MEPKARTAPHRLAGTVLLAAAIALAACSSGDDGPSAASSGTPPAVTGVSTTTGAVDTSISSSSTSTTEAALANPLMATPLQYRDDVVADRMQLQVTNGLDEPLPVAALQFQWAGFSSPITERVLTISPGQRVDLPVPLAPPVCTIDGTEVASSPSLTDAQVVLTLQDGTTRTAAVVDGKGILAGIHAAGCEREMILQQAKISFTGLRVDMIDDRPITVGVLRVQRGGAIGTISVVAASGTIPFMLEFPTATADGPIVQLAPDAAAAEVEVRFAEGRCDAHAVAEAKQPFRFVFQIDLGDGVTRPLVVQPDPSLHAQLLATVADGCAALGLDGTLQPEG